MGNILPKKLQGGKQTKKKIIVAVVSLISVIVMGVMLAACANPSAVGKYKFMSQTTQGVTIEAGSTQNGVTITEDYATIELKDDGSYSLTMIGVSMSGTWTQDGNKVTLTNSEGVPQEATLDGNVLTLAFSEGSVDLTIKFKR